MKSLEKLWPVLTARPYFRMSFLLATALLLLPVFFSACLRYVPKRSEIAAEQGADAAHYADADTFFSLEKDQEARLKQLTEERVKTRSSGTYKLGVEDEVDLSVFDVAELNKKVRVRPNGTISLPLIGEVNAAGLTEEELQQEVASKLTKFVHQPQVNAYISEYAAHKVWVVGEIHRPGPYALKRDNYSLIELLSEAGGRTEKAAALLVLVPAENQQERVSGPAPLDRVHGVEIYMDDLMGSVEKAPLVLPLRAGDTVIVPEVGNIQVDGEVTKPGSFPLASRMTLLGAVATSGGLTYSADVDQVEVIRELGAGKKALVTVNLEKLALHEGSDIRLRDGDVVRVPSHKGRFAARQVINVLNSFFGRFVPSPQ